MPLDFMFRIRHMTLLVRLLVMFLGLIGAKNNDVIIWIRSWTPYCGPSIFGDSFGNRRIRTGVPQMN